MLLCSARLGPSVRSYEDGKWPGQWGGTTQAKQGCAWHVSNVTRNDASVRLTTFTMTCHAKKLSAIDCLAMCNRIYTRHLPEASLVERTSSSQEYGTKGTLQPGAGEIRGDSKRQQIVGCIRTNERYK